MATIKTTFHPNKDLTTFKVTGKLKPDAIYDCLAAYFEGSVTLRTLWDITEATVPSVTADEICSLAKYVRNLSDARIGGKTAIISNDDLGYGMSRMLGTLYELEHIPFEIQVFRNLDEAMDWIGAGCKHGYQC